MRSRLGNWLALKAAVAFVAVVGSVTVGLAGSRQFAGSYKVLQVTNQGSSVQVQLSLRIINYSGADVTDAKVSLQSSLPAGPGLMESWVAQQPVFQGVTLHFNEHKIVPPLEGTFTVPALEYKKWQKGVSPHFVIEFTDASGKLQRQPIELAPQP